MPSRVVPYEEAKKSIIDELSDKYRKAEVNKKIVAITQDKDVVLYTDDIAKLKVDIDRDKLEQMHKEKGKEEAEKRARYRAEDPARNGVQDPARPGAVPPAPATK